MQYICRIDKRKFKLISENIKTDEVVLTYKQRQHIKERHPEILEKYEKYFSKAIEEPDYILKDKSRENTALILKEINNEIFKGINLVLRLSIEGENLNNRNSIITCIPIGENRMKSYINNGQIVYKKE